MSWYVAYLLTLLKQELGIKQADAAHNIFAQKVLPIIEAFLIHKKELEESLPINKEKLEQTAKALQKIVQETPENFYATFLLATCYKIELGLKHDPKKTFELYQISAKAGYVHAIRGLALCYLQAIGVDENEANLSKAIDLLKEGVAKGDPFALYELAGRYEDGEGVKKDIALSNDLLKKAAILGNPKAQYERYQQLYNKYIERLADTTCIGQEREQAKAFIKEAMDLCGKAAEQNHPRAIFKIGLHHFEGSFGAPDPHMASYYFLKAIPLLRDEDEFYLLAIAQEYVARILLMEAGQVQTSREEAANYLEQSLNNRLQHNPTDKKIDGLKKLIFSVAESFENGSGGFKQDKILAERLYKKLAEHGVAQAADRLKVMKDKDKDKDASAGVSAKGAGSFGLGQGDIKGLKEKEAEVLFASADGTVVMLSGGPKADLDSVNSSFKRHMRSVMQQLEAIDSALNVKKQM